jgi:hypothetical protein
VINEFEERQDRNEAVHSDRVPHQSGWDTAGESVYIYRHAIEDQSADQGTGKVVLLAVSLKINRAAQIQLHLPKPTMTLNLSLKDVSRTRSRFGSSRNTSEQVGSRGFLMLEWRYIFSHALPCHDVLQT